MVFKVMSRYIHFKPEKDIYDWLSDIAKSGYRSVPSVVQEILAEKMLSGKNPCTNNNKCEHELTEEQPK